MPTTDTTTALYGNDPGGEILCFKHLGHYATAAITAEPNAREWPTPLGTWYPIDFAMAIAAANAYDMSYKCEECGHRDPALAPFEKANTR